jgi:AcrR family transcriptional regulator
MKEHATKSIKSLYKAYTRQRIIDSAEKLIADRGIEATRIKDIVGLVGISRGAFYQHFHGIHEVIHEILVPLRSMLLARCEAFNSLENWSAPVICVWLQSVHGAWRKHQRAILVIAKEAPDIFQSDFQSQLESYVDALTKCRERWMVFSLEESRRRASLLLLMEHQFFAIGPSKDQAGEFFREYARTRSEIWASCLGQISRNDQCYAEPIDTCDDNIVYATQGRRA